MTAKKTVRTFELRGYGFPVRLENAPMEKIMGEWVPAVNHMELDRAILVAVALRPGRLTGAHVKFIRQVHDMTLDEFAAGIGVTRQAVMKWERKDSEPTGMALPTETTTRMFALSRLNPELAGETFQEAFAHLRKIIRAKEAPEVGIPAARIRNRDRFAKDLYAGTR